VLANQIESCSAEFLVLEMKAALGALASTYRDQGLPVIAWTIRSTEDVELVADQCDNFIFEGFTA
jgi:hypothetical protein